METKNVTAIIVFLVLLAGLSVPAVYAQATSQSTISDNLGRMSDLTTLNGLVKAAGLDSVLNGPGPYTLFAPTNTAFSSIPSDSVNALSGDRPVLSGLLNYYVVPGKITYSDLTRMKELKTIDGKTLPVATKDGALTVGGAQVLSSGVDSKNGIIYPVNSVMTPPGFAFPQVTRSTGIPLSWIGLLLGVLVIGGLLLYMLTRGAGRRKETAMAPPRRVEEPVKRVEPVTKPVEEARLHVPEVATPEVQDITKNLNLPLSGDSLKGLNDLIGMGKFKDKQDFTGFLAKTFFANNLGSMMAGGKEPPTSAILDIINKTGIGRGFLEGDAKKYLVPLLMTGFMAVYKYLTSKPSTPDVQNIVKNVDLPLSGDSLKGFNELVGMGTFKDKPDFLSFLAKTYMANNLGSTISKTNELPVSTVMDIVNKTGIGRGFLEGDAKKYLVPLLMTGFMAIYKYLTRQPAVKAA